MITLEKNDIMFIFQHLHVKDHSHQTSLCDKIKITQNQATLIQYCNKKVQNNFIPNFGNVAL